MAPTWTETLYRLATVSLEPDLAPLGVGSCSPHGQESFTLPLRPYGGGPDLRQVGGLSQDWCWSQGIVKSRKAESKIYHTPNLEDQ